MSERTKFLFAICFYLVALAVQVSGYVNSTVAILIAVVATGFLIAALSDHFNWRLERFIPKRLYDRRLPIWDAARLAYEATEDKVVGVLWNRFGETPDGTLEHFVYGMLGHKEPVLSITGARSPSTVERDVEDRSQLRPIPGTSNLRFNDHRRVTAPTYTNVTISRRDLKTYIAYLNRISDLKL